MKGAGFEESSDEPLFSFLSALDSSVSHFTGFPDLFSANPHPFLLSLPCGACLGQKKKKRGEKIV
jgi:hypothetical protein